MILSKKLLSACFIFVLMCISFSLSAQTENLEIEKIAGKNYYIYTVEPGNTIYAISKKFNIDIEEIEAANPEIKEGLKADQVLKIPVIRANKKLDKQNSPTLEGKYILHVIEKGETLYFLSKKYDITVDNLIDYNPGIDEKISIGDTVRIPSYQINVKDEQSILQATKDNFLRHTVEKGETLFSLAKLYDVSIDSLNNINNNFPVGLREGATIIIPKKIKGFDAEQVSEKDSLYSYVRRKLQKNEVDAMYRQSIGDYTTESVRIALILPFYLDENDTLLSQLKNQEKEEVLTKSRVALSFYKGVKMALDSITQLGLVADLYVVDSNNDSAKLKKMFTEDPKILDADIIIGPLFANTFAAVSPLSQKNKTFIVSPFVRHNQIVENQPFTIKITPSLENQIDANITFIKEKYPDSRVTLVHNEIFLEQDLEKYTRRQVGKSFDSNKVKVYNFKDYKVEEFKKFLVKDENNIIIVPSEDQPFVTDLLTKLSYIKDYHITVFGMESWLNFNNIEIPYFVKLNTHFPSNSYVNYDALNTKNFVKSFHGKFATDPDFFAMKGFDITYWLMRHFYQNFQFNVFSILSEEAFRGIQSDLKMVRKSDSNGLENNQVTILKFEQGKLINTGK